MTLSEAKAMLAKIRALTDDDGPESSMGARWVLGQVQEILGGTSAHPRRASSAIWEEMLVKISRLHRERDELQAEVSRLRKIFDAAGQGEHNVLALVEHYQCEAMQAQEDRVMLVAARRALAHVAEHMTGHAYQELASALEAYEEIEDEAPAHIADHFAKIQALINNHSDTALCDAATSALESIKAEVERLRKTLRNEQEIHDQQMVAVLDDIAAGDGVLELAPQPPPANPPRGAPVWPMAIESAKSLASPRLVNLMHARDQQGRAKYGVPLCMGDGRDTRIDLLQELLDAIVYAEKYFRESGARVNIFANALVSMMDGLLQEDAT